MRELRQQKDNIHRILQGTDDRDEGAQARAGVGCGCGPVCGELYEQLAERCTLREGGEEWVNDEVLDGGLAHVWGYVSLQGRHLEGRSVCAWALGV